MHRVGIFGWGIVAPQCRNVESFTRKLESSPSWLTSFDGFGPSNFLVGAPDFDFADYKEWIDERFPPRRFQQLDSKMGSPTQYALGAFIQSLAQNPGLEMELRELGEQAHVYVGTGLGDFPTAYKESLKLHRSQNTWNRFWADPERNARLREYLDDPTGSASQHPDIPQQSAEDEWCEYWARKSPELARYLEELRAIEAASVVGDVESAKGAVLRHKRLGIAELQRKWDAPQPPWESVSANLLWNIHNTPASQISMIGGLTGMTFAPVAACSTFACALKLGMNAIQLRQAKAVIVGATDPPPHPLSVSTFYNARVLSNDGEVSKPLTGLRGTHISGGAVIWILGDHKHMTAAGFRPLGMEPVSVGVTADADHIITPSKEGPSAAIHAALTAAGASPDQVTSWDLHATATPGDYVEVTSLREILGESVLITARKGTFGHGMGCAGG
ncbi:MAG: beta-ketoacyl synthase N-terminal-like domain-containing protein, partial [Planctomycetota bacterium]